MTKGKGTRSLVISYGLLVLWALVIFKLSSEGHDTSSGRSNVIVEYIQQAGSTLPADVLSFITRKAAHTIAYFIFGILAYNVMRQYKLPIRRALLISFLIVFGYALSDEFHQKFVPGRSSEFRDVMIDTTAGTVGLTAAYLTHKRILKRRVVHVTSEKLKNKV